MTITKSTRRSAIVCMLPVLLAATLCAQPPQTSAVPPLPADIPSTAARYSFILTGNLAGQEATWTASDGMLHIFFQFNDRGRGPKTTSILKLDPSGLPISESITGNDYLKSPITENYSLEAGAARWKNDDEQGEKKISTPAYYAPLNGAPSEIALLAHAALQHGGKIALLPEGETRVQRMTDLDLEAAGHKKHVVLYAASGLDFSPSYLWLQDSDEFFASVDDWGSIVPEGWEDCVKTMLAAQSKVKQSRFADLAAKLAHHSQGDILLTHANVFDAESGKVIPDQLVVVRGNRISSVGKNWKQSGSISPQIIDATNKTLLPGLWDMHAHVGDNDGLLNIAAGVTSVRDLANDTDSLLARRQRIADGKEIGTRIVLAGIIDGRGPYQGPTKVLVSTEAEARAAVDNYKRLGYVQIKIYSSVNPELVPAIIDEAHKNGMRVSGHIPAFMTMEQAIAAGYDEVQHANFWFLNFLFDTVKDTRTPARFTAVAEHAAELDLDSDRVRAFVKLLQDHHTVLDPTVSVFEDMFVGRDGQFAPTLAPAAGRLPPQIRRNFLNVGLPVPAGMDQRYRDSYQAMLKMLKKLHDAGLTIVAGTDDLPGFTLHRELVNYVAAGIPAPRVLQMATIDPARVMKREKVSGSIAAGKNADVILVDGDPTTRITDIRRVVTVIKDGTVYDAAAMYSTLGVKPAE